MRNTNHLDRMTMDQITKLLGLTYHEEFIIDGWSFRYKNKQTIFCFSKTRYDFMFLRPQEVLEDLYMTIDNVRSDVFNVFKCSLEGNLNAWTRYGIGDRLD